MLGLLCQCAISTGIVKQGSFFKKLFAYSEFSASRVSVRGLSVSRVSVPGLSTNSFCAQIVSVYGDT